jgi:hypothetical protein
VSYALSVHVALQVETLDEVSAMLPPELMNSSRPRCFKSMLLCSTFNLFHDRQAQPDNSWLTGLQPFTVGQEVSTKLTIH